MCKKNKTQLLLFLIAIAITIIVTISCRICYISFIFSEKKYKNDDVIFARV